MGRFSKYPYTDFSNLNLDWILQRMREVEAELQRYLDNSVITFADPITWDITEQYTALTVVVDSDGTAYLSKQPVPSGVAITNTNYWLPIFNYDDNINELRAQIAYNAQTSATSGQALNVGDLVFWNGLLYEVTASIAVGGAFVVGSNITKYTVDEKINDFVAQLAQETSDRTADMETIREQICHDNEDSATATAAISKGDLIFWNDEIYEALSDMAAGTALIVGTNVQQYTVDEKINDIRDSLQAQIDALPDSVYVTPEEFGAVGDGVTDDYSAFVQALATDYIVVARGLYYIGTKLTLGYNKQLYCTGELRATYGIELNSTDAILFVKKLTGSGANSGISFVCPPLSDNLGANCRNNVTAGIISGYEACIDFYANINQRGIQYNRVQFDRLINATYGIRMRTPVTRTWVNQNQITGGSIYGGNNDLIKKGVYCVSAGDAEITSNNFKDIAFEGIEEEAVNMTNAHGNMFTGIRMAEEIHGTHWVWMKGCRANEFNGYLYFSIAQIHDEKDSSWTRNYAYFCANHFVFYNLLRGTNTWSGTTEIWTFNGQVVAAPSGNGNYNGVLNTNQQNVDLGTDIDYTLAYIVDGYKVSMPGGGALTLPDMFKTHVNEIVLFITNSAAVTVKDCMGNTLATVTGYGNHLLKWNIGGLLTYAPET